MKKLFICLFTLISLTANSQEYKIENNFKTGKTYHYTVKRAKIDSREPMSKDMAQLTQIEATFSKTNKGLLCVWKYGESEAIVPEEYRSFIGPEYKELFNLYRGFEIKVLLDPENGGAELQNYAETKENIMNSLLKVYKNKMTKIDSATMVLINQQIAPTYSTPEILLSSYFPEIALYFNLYSRIFKTGYGIKYESFYPNPIGGEAIPVFGEMKIDTVKNNILVIQTKEQPNQEEVNRIMKDMLEKMSKKGDSPIKREDIPAFTLKTESSYYYDLRKKIINKVEYKKIVTTSGISQTDILEINLKK